MKKLILAALLATTLVATGAHAVPPPPPTNDLPTSTPLSAAGACSSTGTGAYLRTVGRDTVGVNVTGTWVGTLTFKAAVDDKATFNTVATYPQGGGAPVTTASANGTWFIPAAGYRFVCVYFSAYTSGTATVLLNGSVGQQNGFVPSPGSQFSCQVAVSTGTSLAAVGGSCAAPGAGLSLYITDIAFGSSAAGGTAADSFPTLKSGTGGTCGTATAVIWQAMTAANTTVIANHTTPIKVAANSEVCWIMSTAGSKTLNIQGFIAP